MTTQHELNSKFKEDRKAAACWESARLAAGVTPGHPVEEQAEREAPMTTNDTRTLTELQAEAAELYPMPLDGDRIENACAYAARHAHIAALTARDAEPATDPELRAAVNALKDAAKSINVIVSTGIDLSPEELDLIDACASGAAQGWLMAQAARIEGDEA